MPNTAPLLVKRKLSQSLGAVREAWCQKQNLPRDVADQVFFTWRGRRLYNVTTCQRLGIEVDARGHVVRADDRDKDGAAKVHVVAMTEELLRREKMDKARQAGGEGDDPAAESETHGGGVGDGDGDEPARSSKREVKIIVKARDKKPVQVRVFSVSVWWWWNVCGGGGGGGGGDDDDGDDDGDRTFDDIAAKFQCDRRRRFSRSKTTPASRWAIRRTRPFTCNSMANA
jgi:hypothetical protein